MLPKLQIRYTTHTALTSNGGQAFPFELGRVIEKVCRTTARPETPPGQRGTDYWACIETSSTMPSSNIPSQNITIINDGTDADTLHVLVAALASGRPVKIVEDGDTIYVELGKFNFPSAGLLPDAIQKIEAR